MMDPLTLLTLILLSLGLSLDDFSLAFALSLLMPSGTLKRLIVNAGKIAVAFSISTALLPLLGWLIGLAMYRLIVSFSAWVVLAVFTVIGAWIVREALEDEQPEWIMKRVSSFWELSAIGILSSIDEGAIGISYPFLGIPIIWIIIAVILANTILILFASFLSSWIKTLSRRIPSILSGTILITLGILKFLELAFGD
jgi:putative Mn2+ efflux pump MntP